MAAGIEVSVGSHGDAYNNALAESLIGLYKMEVIRHAGPWRRLDDVEYARRNGSPGSTRAGCWSRSASFPQRSTKRSLPSCTHLGGE
jgi:hypothetical protein